MSIKLLNKMIIYEKNFCSSIKNDQQNTSTFLFIMIFVDFELFLCDYNVDLSIFFFETLISLN